MSSLRYKHIDIKYLFVKEKVNRISYLCNAPIEHMLASPLTKGFGSYNISGACDSYEVVIVGVICIVYVVSIFCGSYVYCICREYFLCCHLRAFVFTMALML
jgi:hypothetical protein